MKIAFLLLVVSISFNMNSQTLSGYWVPLKRIEQIEKFKIDRCDSLNEFPFKKIKFYSSRKVSLFGYDAPDPDMCSIVRTGNGEWHVENLVLNTLYPEYAKGSKIILRIKNDTLTTSLTKNGNTFFQKFVRKYSGITFTNYWETEIGNLLVKGKYTIDGSGDTMQFFGNGKITVKSANGRKVKNFISFKFDQYSMDCKTENTPRKIIKLTNFKSKTQLYFMRRTKKGFDFYKIKSMEDSWTVGQSEFGFSLSLIP